jgi:hypothetical protein
MSISFPRSLSDLADLLSIAAVQWGELRSETGSPVGSGEFLTHSLGPVLWTADVTSTPMPHAEAEQMRARIGALDGSSQAFYLFNPLMKYPQSDPGGANLGTATVTIDSINVNRKALKLAGLPAGYLLTIGDYFHVDYDSSPYRRALIQIAESATADGSGLTLEFEVRPHLRPGISAGASVSLIKPAAKVKVMPDTLAIEQAEDATMSRVRFSARQTLQKG